MLCTLANPELMRMTISNALTTTVDGGTIPERPTMLIS